jgi:uncharacterized glyoxalase superfamily protein PhnB
MSTETTPSPQVWPTLRAEDAPALIRFLTEAFGFEETVVYRDGDQVHHAELAWPEGGGVMLGSYVVTDHPDEVFARAKAAGAEILQEIYETDYGSRDFRARDPEGNRWSFGTYRGHPRQSR